MQSMDTAGRAVLFAGTTVVIALLGMMLLGVEFLYGVAISASIGVLLVMLGSLTLLPALLMFAGRRVARPSRRARARAARAEKAGEPAPASGGVWLRWSAGIQRRPWAVALVSASIMLVIAAPAMALRLGSSDASNDPAGQTTHRAYELLAKGFGEGFNGPLLVVAKTPQGAGGQPAAGAGDVGSAARPAGKGARRRRGRPCQGQSRRRRVGHHRLPALLAPGLRDRPAGGTPAWRRGARRSSPRRA